MGSTVARGHREDQATALLVADCGPDHDRDNGGGKRPWRGPATHSRHEVVMAAEESA